MKDYIVGLGEILFDVLPEGPKLGGAPANFAYHACQFGLNGLAVSAIGPDALGRDVQGQLTAKHLPCQLQQVDYPTGTVQVSLDGKGVPTYDICPEVAYDYIPWTPELASIARETRAVCFGTLAQRSQVSRNTILRFLDALPPHAVKIYDINLRQHWFSREIIEESLRRATILKINDEEIRTVRELLGQTGLDDVAFCRWLMQQYALELVILTCGENGSSVVTPTEVSFQQTPHVPVADTVGAGDAFTAAFCAAYLHPLSLGRAHELAVDVSAYVCTQLGAMPQLPDGLRQL